MVASPITFLFRFLFVSIILWVVFIFVVRLLAWALSHVVGISIGLRIGGLTSLRNVVVKLNKGAVESVSIGEIKLCLRKSSVKLGTGVSKNPKLQLSICNLEISLRTSKSKKGTAKRTQKAKKNKPRSSGKGKGKGKWKLIANIARFFSLSMTKFVLKTPKATLEVKDLQVDIFRVGKSDPRVLFRLLLSPIVANLGEPQVSYDHSSSYSDGDGNSILASDQSTSLVDKPFPSFRCNELSVSCEFGHNRESGIVIKETDISVGEISVNLNEKSLQKNKTTSNVSANIAIESNVSDIASDKASDSTISATATDTVSESSVNNVAVNDATKKEAVSPMTKLSRIFPEKASFSLPKFAVRFEHLGHGLLVESHIKGVQLKSNKSRSSEDGGESTRIDFQLDFGEIHLLRDSGVPALAIPRINIGGSLNIPLQPTSAARADTYVKIGGIQVILLLNRLEPWMRLHFSKKKTAPREEVKSVPKPKSAESKANTKKMITWTCMVSTPETIIVLHSLSGMPLYHGSLQSSHVSANNISNKGTEVHAQLGELNLLLADEYQEGLKECLFGVETNSGCMLRVAKVGIDLGKKDVDTTAEDVPKSIQALTVEVSGMGFYLTMRRVESLVVTAVSLQGLFKKLKGGGKKIQVRGSRPSKSSGKGTRLLKFNLDQFSINICADVGLDNTVIEDPKRVNYGSQGGRFVVTVSEDGSKRVAHIFSTVSDECKKLKYSISLDITRLSVCLNKDKQSTQLDLERARTIYQECPDDRTPGAKLVLLDIQNPKFVRRAGGLKEVSVCSLFSATDITVRWEPDFQISIFELLMHLKLLAHSQKIKEEEDDCPEGAPLMPDSQQGMEVPAESAQTDKQNKKKETVFAVDVEMLNISAEAGDGVEVIVKVQSIFSENARIGVLLEGLLVSINGCRLLKSSRLQISRIPKTSSSPDGTSSTIWDFVVQGLDVHVCLPYRLELRAVDDSVEDQIRALKLIMDAKKKLIYPFRKESSKPKKSSSSKFGCVKFSIRKLTCEIEEEPLQGWLDEHYHLLKKEAHELTVRLNFLDELVSKGEQSSASHDTTESSAVKRVNYDGVDIDLQDPGAIQKLREDIYRQSFQSYYKACQNVVACEGSGACRNGFQAGFRPSKARTSVFTIVATDLDVTVIQIKGGEAGMIDVVKRLDPISLEHDIPFAKLYGAKFLLHAGTLAALIRDYAYPLFSGTSGKCDGCVVLAQQATPFQPQMRQDVYVGNWRRVNLLRSASGTTPPMKPFLELPIHFQKGEGSFGVSYEPVFADISYAFTVALRRANLSIRNPNPPPPPPKKEKSLPWWDDMRNYIHGDNSLFFSEIHLVVLATADPYEKFDKLQILTGYTEVHQSDGRIYASAKDFKVFTSSLENMARFCSVKLPADVAAPVLQTPIFSIEVNMEWDCDSRTPLFHYLFALPNEGKARDKVFDPFRSTSFSFQWNISLKSVPSEKPSQSLGGQDGTLPISSANSSAPGAEGGFPSIKLAAHDLAWIMKFYILNYLPPCKLRIFSRCPRFGVPRIPRSGNLSLDRVMTEFNLRLDSTPICIKHIPMASDDPSKGLTFNLAKLKVEFCQSRGRQRYTFESKREPLDLVYLGVDLHVPKLYLDRDDCTAISDAVQLTKKGPQPSSVDKVIERSNYLGLCSERPRDDGFILSSDYFTMRKQSPKADPARLVAWQEAGKTDLQMTYVRAQYEDGNDSDNNAQSDGSDDEDGYNVVIADSCLRVFVYGLKLHWNIENRDAILSVAGAYSKAAAPPKPSPSRQYVQRKLLEEKQKLAEAEEQDSSSNPSLDGGGGSSSCQEQAENQGSLPSQVQTPTTQAAVVAPAQAALAQSSPAQTAPEQTAPAQAMPEGVSAISIANTLNINDSEEGTRHFMVNVVEPQFNLHSEEANGRFLLAAVSGRVLARSFHSVLHVGQEMIKKEASSESGQIPETVPEMPWKRVELSAMLEHVQAHVAPTDVDPGAGIQWLPKIRKSSPKVKRTGALLERVFTPGDMFFRFTRHKGGTPELKMKPLKELTFNSHNITAVMTSRQFQVMMDVLTNLLLARPPKPRKNGVTFPSEDDDDVEEESDAVVPDGVEEVELAKINLEEKEREKKLLLDDIWKLSLGVDASEEQSPEKEGELWMIAGGKSALVQRLKNELGNAKKSRKVASASLRTAMQKAAELRLMEKEKNKSPSYAMRISVQVNKVGMSMLADGKAFAEAEINEMIYHFDRDYKDIGVARFTIKNFAVKNGLPNAKCDTLLAPWSPPSEWGKKVMVRVDAKQGPPKDGNSSIELLQVEIYPLKIHLTESMYRMMWAYLFPGEEQDSQRRQEAWKVSTTAGLKRAKKGSSGQEGSGSNVTETDTSQGSKQNKSKPELRRTSSCDKWEENVAESVANELMLSLEACEQEEAAASSKAKSKDPKQNKAGRATQEEKKGSRASDDKKTRPKKLVEFHNIKISQVELLVTYEGSRFAISDLRLLMDQFKCVEFTGTWSRLFSRVKKHIIWGVLKSVTGMQMKKFKDKMQTPKEIAGPGISAELNLSDSDDEAARSGAGDGFVTSVRGLFNNQRRKAKQMVLRTMRGEENELPGEWSEGDVEISPFARQLTITKAKKLIKRHTRKFSKGHKGSLKKTDELPSPDLAALGNESDSEAPEEGANSRNDADKSIASS